jgi:hypothetical protein
MASRERSRKKPARRRRLARAAPRPEALQRLRQLALGQPGDAAAHLVYADALLEAGVAEGELIARMCAGLESAPLPMIERLLGRLRASAEDWTIERGFLRSVGLRRITPTEFTRLTGRHEWEGVTSVRISRGASQRPLGASQVTGLLTHPVMRMLRAVEGIDQPTFLALCAHPLSLDRLGVTDNLMWRSPPMPEPRLRVRHLSLRLWSSVSEINEWLMGAGSPLISELESVHVEGFHDEDLDWLAVTVAPRLTRVTGRTTSATRDEDRWSVTLDPCRGISEGEEVRWALRDLPRQIARCAPFTSRLVLRLPGVGEEWLEPIRRAALVVPTTFESTGTLALQDDGDEGD